MLPRSRFKTLNLGMWVWVALGLVWSLYEHARGAKTEPEKQKGPQEAHTFRGVGGAVEINLTHSSSDYPTESPSKRSQENDDFPCATCNRWSQDCCNPWETPQEHDE